MNTEKHAKALRAAATFDREARTSIVLKKIASEYEHMAHALEAVNATNEAVRAQ
jgi:hypothetical protein